MFAVAPPLGFPSSVEEICRAEQYRQWEHLILIASESICFPEAARTLACEFGNIYAEGQPNPILCHDSRDAAADERRFLGWHRRLGDARFYRGCVNADRVELLAHRHVAEAFALLPGSPPACDIHVNVQALSGAPANMAVYTALMKPGEVVMGLDLSNGGHLTHGSVFNFSGRAYRSVPYRADPATRRLDYEDIRRLAIEHRPRMIIGGASAYPWDFDWPKLRAIADEAGAVLLADIAHLAGMVVAGVLSNPLPHAHVVTFTTHKTLCGPRGAVILTCDPRIRAKLNAAVFPGLQGGPHMNTIAGIARLFEIILRRRDDFVRLQRAVVENAATMARSLVAEGFRLEYGGTNTHMLLVDLKQFPLPHCPDARLDGETAARLLENVGIVCNKNTLPGDDTAGHSSGIRFGAPWLTQRGIAKEQIRELCAIVKLVLGSARTTKVWVPSGEERCRGRVPLDVFEEASRRVRAIAEALPYPPRPPVPPHEIEPAPPAVGDRRALLVRGAKAALAIEQMLTARTSRLPVGEFLPSLMLDGDGRVLDDVLVSNLGHSDGEDRFALLPHAGKCERVKAWVGRLSDGYVLIDADDLYAKVDGPCVVEPLPQAEADESFLRRAAEAEAKAAALRGKTPAQVLASLPEASDMTKPYFIGRARIYAGAAPPALPPYRYEEKAGPLMRTVLNEAHKSAGAKMVPFAGWEMPVEYPTGIFREHAAVRSAAGLFDVSHMGVFEAAGPRAMAFLDAVLANCVTRLNVAQAQYNYLLYPDGAAADDLYVYRIERDRFLLVVNAANAARDFDWLKALAEGRCAADPEFPGIRLDPPERLRDLRDAGDDSLIDLALQGPLSVRVLAGLCDDPGQRWAIGHGVPNSVCRLSLRGIPALAARTGYTGEEIGCEIFVHPANAGRLWEMILDAGRPLGVLPAGLGARDSTRVEAGFPLFGHELEGPHRINLTEAGYGFVSRFHVPFYVGRRGYVARAARDRRRILRLKGFGRRSVRPGHLVVDATGKPAATITSFAFTDAEFTFHALAIAGPDFNPQPGSKVRAVRMAESQYTAPAAEDKIVEMTVCTRFATPDEKAGWREKYGQRPAP